MGAKEYFNSSGNDQKRLENGIFRTFLLFVISRSGVRVRLPAPIPAARRTEYGGIPEWPKGADCKSVVSDFGGSNPPSPTNTAIERLRCFFVFSRFLNICRKNKPARTLDVFKYSIAKLGAGIPHDDQIFSTWFYGAPDVTYAMDWIYFLIELANDGENYSMGDLHKMARY